jgi:predicted permease
MDGIVQDLRYGMRMVVKNPSVTFVVVITLALGIGFNTAIFSIVNAVLLRPLPVQNAARLVYLAEQKEGSLKTRLSYPDFQDFRSQTEAFSGIVGCSMDIPGLSVDGRADPILVNQVSGNFFGALGLKPALGRVFSGEDTEKRGSDPVIVLGYQYWESRFGGDPAVLGKQVKLNGVPAVIIGVGPKGFHGTFSFLETQAYLPFGLQTVQPAEQDTDFWTRRDNRTLTALGILKPGISLRAAQSSIDVVTQRLIQLYPEADKGLSVKLYPERLARPQPAPGNPTLIIGLVFTVLVGLVLLLACTNVANILLVRASNRQREIAVRAALGAGHARLVRQIMTESFIYAFLGGAAGLLLGNGASRLLSSIRFTDSIPFQLDFSFDWRVFAYAFAIALLTGMVAGFFPASRASRTKDLNRVLHEESRGLVRGGSRLRSVLVVAQVAGSVVLLVVAGLFVRSAQSARHLYLGFDPDHVLDVTMDTHSIDYDPAKTQQFYHDLKDRVRILPGVQSVSTAAGVPMDFFDSSVGSVYVEGQGPARDRENREVGFNSVDPEYFSVMRVPLMAGRAFTEDDNDKAPRVAIINQEMAKRLWPNQDPIGKRFSAKDPSGPFMEVVGVSANGKYIVLFEHQMPFYYVPQAQSPTTLRTLQLRSTVAPESLIGPVEEQIRNLAPDMTILAAKSMQRSLEGGNGFFIFRLGAGLTGCLGLLGMILAVVGVYGVISYITSQRTREIGLRMALGASRGGVLKMVLRQGLWLLLAGVTTGLAISVVAVRAMSSLLLGVSAGDPLTFGAVTLLLALVGMAACLIPARRAMEVDPLIVLRCE